MADRQGHAQAVLQALDNLRPGEDAPGVYVALIGRVGESIDADKFDKSGMRLLSVVKPLDGERTPGEVVFFAPPEALAALRGKIEKFRDEDTAKGRPKNADLVQSIGRLERAKLRSLWRGPATAFPNQVGPVDWEVWVLSNEAETFAAATTAAGAHVAADRLDFPEVTVLQVTAPRAQLAKLIATSAGVTALARPSTTADFFDSLPVAEQPGWSRDLLARTTFGPAQSYVTLLDTGVSLGHPLLAGALDAGDRHAADPAWSLDDSHGHGTGMAGLAIYGDLTTALHTQARIEINHRLESVKIIPDASVNPHHLLGAVTRRAVNAAEAGGERLRVFTLASSTPDDHPHDGAPTSWSTEIDQLAAGRSGDRKAGRLLIVAAGNVKAERHETANYHPVCDGDDEEIESPAQAWNAITVGATTDKTVLSPGMGGAALASAGDLSPFSKTASWSATWPLKPDIVLEGGNLVLDGLPPAMSCADLSLLSTHNQPADRHYTTFEATSAASALAARMAAVVWAENPDRWPETVRALLVSSARWTQPMLAHLPQEAGKGGFERLFQRYGYGVPDLRRAAMSATNAVTLIAEDQIVPYGHSATRGAPAVHNQIKLHGLPWPVEALRGLGARPVTLRVAVDLRGAQSRRSRAWSQAAVRIPWVEVQAQSGQRTA